MGNEKTRKNDATKRRSPRFFEFRFGNAIIVAKRGAARKSAKRYFDGGAWRSACGT